MIDKRAQKDLLATQVWSLVSGFISWDEYDAIGKSGGIDWREKDIKDVYLYFWTVYDPEESNEKPTKDDVAKILETLR